MKISKASIMRLCQLSLLPLGFVIFFYLVYSTIYSPNGLIAYSKAQRTHARLQITLDGWNQEQAHWQKTVDRVMPLTLSYDMIDELARKKLGFVGENDRVFYLSDPANGVRPTNKP